MRVLVLGGNGLIGNAVVRLLVAAGHDVTGLGREVERARLLMPAVAWVSMDLAGLGDAAAWGPLLQQTRPEAIVNCAGALQDGWRDDVAALQSRSMRALYEALEGRAGVRFVQVSATRATVNAETAFMRSKGEADAALRASRLEWTILRPGLVIAPEAYGGTALLRAMAGLPMVSLLVAPGSLVQTVGVEDVAAAVAGVLAGEVPSRRTYDLVEDEPAPLRDVVRRMRAWLGLPPAREVVVPLGLVSLVARCGDMVGWLGWRAPLRTTALVELAAGIRGDAAPWRLARGASVATLAETLSRLPSTVQERWFARSFLLKPVAIGALSLFWIATGLIALAQPGEAADVLATRGTPEILAVAVVVAGALADIGLGIGVAIRAWSGRAAAGMIVLTLGYLVGGTLLAPDLWADPLGPLLKALPVLVLSLIPLALSDDR